MRVNQCLEAGTMGLPCLQNSTCTDLSYCISGTCTAGLLPGIACSSSTTPCADGLVCGVNTTASTTPTRRRDSLDLFNMDGDNFLNIARRGRRSLNGVFDDGKHSIFYFRRSPTVQATSSTCLYAGAIDQTCYNNGTCAIGGVCASNNNTCVPHLSQANETYTLVSDCPSGQTCQEIDCDSNLRCTKSQTVVISGYSYSLVNVTQCAASVSSLGQLCNAPDKVNSTYSCQQSLNVQCTGNISTSVCKLSSGQVCSNGNQCISGICGSVCN